ncbi:DNA translocase FtsK 4TM domain-containing protein, partial [Planctomycetota bacterium]
MFEDRDQRIDLIALFLFGLTAFLGLSLLSYSPADPVGDFAPLSAVYQPKPVVYPPSEQVGNMCGAAGAFLADMTLTVFGWGAHYIFASLTVLAFCLLFRRPMRSPLPRVFGWVMTLFAIATFSNMFTHSLWSGPVIGPGGYLGALCTGILNQHFALPGSVIITFSVMLAGVLLCTDYLMFQLLGIVGAASVDRV